MLFLFFSLLSFLFKWQRFIFIIISLEFMVLSLFIKFSYLLNSYMFFYFMCFTVISSVMGMVLMVGGVKFFGSDLSVFYSFKLSLNYRFSKPKIVFCSGYIMIKYISFSRKSFFNLSNLILV